MPKKWSESKRMEALQAFVIQGNAATAARETGVPPSTVARWVVEDSQTVAELRSRYVDSCTDEFLKATADFRETFSQREQGCASPVSRAGEGASQQPTRLAA